MLLQAVTWKIDLEPVMSDCCCPHDRRGSLYGMQLVGDEMGFWRVFGRLMLMPMIGILQPAGLDIRASRTLGVLERTG